MLATPVANLTSTQITVSSSNQKDRQLIFDIGLHNGDDAAYYLDLGNRVVGVEANPLLAAACVTRFSAEIEQGRMTVVNYGVMQEPGSFTFYRNLQDDGWSSFQPEKGKKDGPWEELVIACVTTQQLIEEFGKPFFMKVDIEGADLQALASLTPDTAPVYVSLELSYRDPILEKLIDLGYASFKFVNGETYWPSPPIFEHQIGWRVLRKIGRVAPIVRSAIGMLPLRLRPNSEYDPPWKYSPGGYQFGPYSSGPFGEQAAGEWLNSDAALRWFGRLKENYRVAGTEDALWWDVHARHVSYTLGRS